MANNGPNVSISQNLVALYSAEGAQPLFEGDYAGHAAAAIGGVAVGQFYRNGSILMIRAA